MSIILDLKPETEARARANAAAQGLAVQEYLQSVLEQVLPQLPRPAQRVSQEEFEAIMDELAAGSENLPPPPVFTREEIYGDHD
jgi:hypothetical protein